MKPRKALKRNVLEACKVVSMKARLPEHNFPCQGSFGRSLFCLSGQEATLKNENYLTPRVPRQAQVPRCAITPPPRWNVIPLSLLLSQLSKVPNQLLRYWRRKENRLSAKFVETYPQIRCSQQNLPKIANLELVFYSLPRVWTGDPHRASSSNCA